MAALQMGAVRPYNVLVFLFHCCFIVTQERVANKTALQCSSSAHGALVGSGAQDIRHLHVLGKPEEAAPLQSNKLRMDLSVPYSKSSTSSP